MPISIRPSKNVFLQVLWSGVDSSVPSLFMFTDKKNYVFNCGEGLQRLFAQKKLKLGRLDQVFLTRYQWSHMGGLCGFGMTVRDIYEKQLRHDQKILAERTTYLPTGSSELGRKSSERSKPVNGDSIQKQVVNVKMESLKQVVNVKTESEKQVVNVKTESEKRIIVKTEWENRKKLMVYSPRGITGILEGAKTFLFTEMETTEHHLDDELQIKSYDDDEISIYPISISHKNEKKQVEPCSQYDTTVKTVDISPEFQPPVVCYACHLHSLPGKFDAKKAEQLGVPNGPLRAELLKGDNIVLDNGNTVAPHEVIGPEIPGPIFLVIDCPSVSYIESLVENCYLDKYVCGGDCADLVLHYSPKDVCRDDRYTEWTNKFPTTTKHIYLNELQQENIPFESQHSLQIMLNCIHSKFFPLVDQRKCVNGGEGSNKNVLKNFTKINVRMLLGERSKLIDERESKSEVNHSELLGLANRLVKGECVDDAEMNVNSKRVHEAGTDSIPTKKRNINGDSSSTTSRTIFPKIICLGTGASLPSKYRNVSATLVLLSEDDAVLLDCGEGTHCELDRHYGDEVDVMISKIKLIFISHMHPDHHLGLITLISKLNQVQKQTNDSVLIMAPSMLFTWLSNYARISESLKFKFISCEDAYSGFPVMKNMHIKPVKVNHPGCAHGIVIDYDNNLKLTYSGDTKPCEALIIGGMNSNLLIHEATFEDKLIEDALEKQHSTSSQAIEVARKMNAEYILLTHISQRYPKIPVLSDNTLSCRTAFAFDHMEVTLDDIPKFNELVPTLNTLSELLDEAKEAKKNELWCKPSQNGMVVPLQDGMVVL